MGLFDRLKSSVFLKDDSDAERQLAELEKMSESATGDALKAIRQELMILKAGIAGEKQVHFELENSHIPMYVIHDLYLEYEGLSAQIDYLIITHMHVYVVECKNLYGDIEINSNGDFVRTFSYGRYRKKEGIYSPITQNRRHMELIKQIRAADKGFLLRGMFEKNFFKNYRSIVVLSNPKTVLNAKYAKKEVRNQVIRVDQLAEYIRKTDKEPDAVSCSDKEMEKLAQYFLDLHKQNPMNYTEKYRIMITEPEGRSSAAQKEEAVLTSQDQSVQIISDQSVPINTDQLEQTSLDQSLSTSQDQAVSAAKDQVLTNSPDQQESATQDQPIQTSPSQLAPESPNQMASTSSDQSADGDDQASESSEDRSEKEQIVCPKCGGAMVKRMANRGKNAGKYFYGCSNFPKCRGIISIEN